MASFAQIAFCQSAPRKAQMAWEPPHEPRAGAAPRRDDANSTGPMLGVAISLVAGCLLWCAIGFGVAAL